MKLLLDVPELWMPEITLMLCRVTLSAVAIALACSSACFGWQSGNRGPAPAAPSTGGPIVESFSAPPLGQSAAPFNGPAITQPFRQPFPLNSQGAQTGQTSQFHSAGIPNNGVLLPENQQRFAAPSSLNSGQQQTGSGSSSGSGSFGIPDSSLVDPIFEINDPASANVIDHSIWDHFLSRYLSTDRVGIARVLYRVVSVEDRELLDCYLQQLQSTDIRNYNRNEQLAFWFNLYNARTVSLVLENYPIRSVRQIKENLTDFVGPFDDEGAVTVLGKPLSLNDIESGIVRPVWNDPRIHYALNCASYSCPNLAPTAWTANDLDARLNGAAWEYINSGRAIKRSLFGLRVSKIYKWYEADFGGSDAEVLNHFRSFADQRTLSIISRRQITGYFYDWSLNDGRIQRQRILEAFRR